MHKTLAEIQFNIQVYLASWHAMCQASRAIAVGLAKLAQDSSGGGGGGSGGQGVDADGRDKKSVSSLMDTVSADPDLGLYCSEMEGEAGLGLAASSCRMPPRRCGQ